VGGGGGGKSELLHLLLLYYYYSGQGLTLVFVLPVPRRDPPTKPAAAAEARARRASRP